MHKQLMALLLIGKYTGILQHATLCVSTIKSVISTGAVMIYAESNATSLCLSLASNILIWVI